MFGNGTIKAINEGAALRTRALAYAQNNNNVSVADATVILIARDAKAKKVRKSHAKARSAK